MTPDLLQPKLDAAIHDLAIAYSKAVSDWLGSCVQKFCPDAYAAFIQGNHSKCSHIITSRGYHYQNTLDGSKTIHRFMQHDTPLAAATFNINLTIKTPDSSESLHPRS